MAVSGEWLSLLRIPRTGKAAAMIHDLIPCIYLLGGRSVTGFGQTNLLGDGDPVTAAREYSDRGADRLLIFDFSDGDAAHDAAIDCIREIVRTAQIPVLAAGNIRRAEDVKKLLYAGCERAVLNGSKDSNLRMLEDVSKRFGRDHLAVSVSDYAEFDLHRDAIGTWADTLLLLDDSETSLFEGKTDLHLIVHSGGSEKTISDLLRTGPVSGVTGGSVSRPGQDLIGEKLTLRNQGIRMDILTSTVPWSEFTKNDRGLVPCIVQDARTDEVLMMAWMNEKSFRRTLDTGRMTYFSRSRQTLWMKGETSGHVQYVQSLSIDCDRDTMLAKVVQVGAACHTGHHSCFYTPLASKESRETNPYHVFEQVMRVILDRREHPKEGSYTNYLFDKGIDKILKKVGEENTEIIIAAKNPNREEIRYEIADYLYHLMVLMAERGVTWEEITDELARR